MRNIGVVTTENQLDMVYGYMEEILDNLDPQSIHELSQGSGSDVDHILQVLFEETSEILIGGKYNKATESIDYLERFSGSVEESLRKMNFNYFVTSVMPDFEMNWHNVEWNNMIQIYKWLCIIAARDHGKSYNMSMAYPIWKAYRYEAFSNGAGVKNREYSLSKEGMLITNEITLARHLLGILKGVVEDNDILSERLRPSGKIGWGSDGVAFKNGATLNVKSAGSRMRGYHPTYIILDDFLDESSLYSKEQRDKFLNIFNAVIMNMIVKNGQVIVVGTPFHEVDLYAKIKKSKAWKVFEYPAIFPDGSLLWENRHDLDDLLEKRESQGSLMFSREILVKPISSESSIFPYDILKRSFIGMDDHKIVDNITNHKMKFAKIVVGCDFAISANVGADYSVFSVMGIDSLGNYWLLYSWRQKGANYQQQLAALKKINRNFSPDIFFAESNAMQKIFIQLMEEANLPVYAHHTGVNKYSLIDGLPSLAVLFEQQKVRFPRGDERSKDVTDLYCGELNGITWTDKEKLGSVTEHDDTVMSLWLALKAAKYIPNFEVSWMDNK